jgi:hypothetical protein
MSCRRSEKNNRPVIVMKTKTDSLMKDLPLPQTAANGDFPQAADTTEKVLRPRVAGWDPYEVWRTRVKAMQDIVAAKSGRGS